MDLSNLLSILLVFGALVTSESSLQQERTVALVDVLVEGQSLYTLATERAPQSLSEALDLARRAQTLTADATLRQQGWDPRTSRPDEVGRLAALRARIAELIGTLDGRYTSLLEKYRNIQSTLKERKISATLEALSNLPSDMPTADTKLPFGELRTGAEGARERSRQLLAQAKTAAAAGLVPQAVQAYEEAEAIDADLASYDSLRQQARRRGADLRAKSNAIRSHLSDHRVAMAEREAESANALLPADEATYHFQTLQKEILEERQKFNTAVSGARAAARDGSSGAYDLFKKAQQIDRDQNLDAEIRTVKPPPRLRRRAYGVWSAPMFLYGPPSTAQFNQTIYTRSVAFEVAQTPQVYFGHYEVGAAGRLGGALAIGVTYAETERRMSGELSGRIPFPTATSSTRPFTGPADIKEMERAYHVEVRAQLGGKHSETVFFIGPSFIDVDGGRIVSVTVRELTGGNFTVTPNSQPYQEHRVGLNLGFDLSAFPSRFIGVGGGMRYVYSRDQEGAGSVREARHSVVANLGLRIRY
jgi:tetratricopeptide (TPR) repeat protein